MNLNQLNDQNESAVSILNTLRGKGALWHRTSVLNLKSINKDGFITPNIGQFETTYAQSTNSLARHLNAISLFDFDSNSTKKVLSQSHNWTQFLTDQGVATIIIRIEKKKLLKDRLIMPWSPNFLDELKISSDGMEYYPTRIPYVEVLYSNSIPIGLFEEFYVVKNSTEFSFEKIKPDECAIQKIEQLEVAWKKEEDENIRVLRAKNPSPTIEDMLSNPLLYKDLFPAD